MIDFRGFSAWITCDDMELAEFEPRFDEKNRTVTCWIAGPVGKAFIVHWRDHGSQVDSASYIYFDGFKVSGQFLFGYGEELRRGVRVSPQEDRSFVFSKIEADDGVGFGNLKPHKNVGSIMLEIKQVQRMESFDLPQVRAAPPVIRGHRPEGEVIVKYGETRAAPIQKPTWKIRPYDPNDPGPFVTFIFRYRTHDWLLSQGIVGPDEAIFREAPEPWPLHDPGALMTPSTGSTALTVSELPPDEDEDEDAYSSDEPGDDADNEFRPPPELRFSLEPEPSSSSGRAFQSGAVPSPSPSPDYGDNPNRHYFHSAPAALGSSSARPEGSQRPSSSGIRSFSGSWDPNSASGEYETLSWGEYRPEDSETLAKFYD
ncbi:hypothetical protein TRAPUB_2938 [Trametes pubescens]|uniref:DUF7918 domain-containing protein n=1 Tax=Trametes pubescens TaxID=154538 RepID=A0A1M2VF80_TRAPU|nr:hypothetical protein TRAPUB_2938 [Trametes pubescens]